MSDGTRFTMFCFATVVALLVGYVGRVRGVCRESWSRPIHHFVLVYCWTATYFLGTWHLPVAWASLWVPALILLTIAIPALLIGPVARWIGLPPAQVGVTIIAAGIGNTGFTLGAYLCFVLFEPPADAMGYAATWAALNIFGLVLVIYPLIRRCGQLDDPGVSTARLIVRSFTTRPALPMYGALTGWTLAACRVQPPAFLVDLHVIDAAAYVVCVGSYFGIGLRLRLGETLAYLRGHALVAAFAFLVTPMVMAGLIGLTLLTPHPVDPLAARVLMVESLMPVGVSTVLVANVFHLDARMAGNVWLWNTLGFLAVILPMIWLVAG